MSYQPVIPLRLRSLFDVVCDELADPEQVAELEAILRADEDARRLYLMYCRLHVDLHFAVRGQRLLDQIGDSLASNCGAKAPAGNKLSPLSSPPDQQPVKSPVLGFLGGVVDYVNHSRRLMFLLVAVMLFGWFAFQIGSVLLGRWGGNAQVADRGADQSAVPGHGQKRGDGLPSGPGQPHDKALAWLSGSVGSRWQIVAPMPVAGSHAGAEFWEIGTEFTARQQVRLTAGLGEITFRSGAKVVVSAPAQFSVTSALGTDLQVGKLSVRVPHDSSDNGPSHPGATGFTVSTPAGSVVDLGTEFGVEVTPEHKLDVQVFVGEVKINAPSGGRGQPVNAEVRVTAGKTLHLEPGHPATIVESQDKDRFQRDLKIATDSRDKQVTAYLELMRQLKPAVWFRMEGKETDRVLHDETGGPDAQLIWNGPGNPFVKGPVGNGLWLRGPQLKEMAFVPNYPKAEHGKLSVVAWAYADSRPVWPNIASNWFGQFHLALFSEGSAGGVDLCARVKQTDGKDLLVREGAAHPFPLNDWQHVALTTDGTTLRLYRQGREVAQIKHNGIKFPAGEPSLTIGGTFPTTNPSCYWSGQLDEVAVFNGTLTPEDIKKLADMPPR